MPGAIALTVMPLRANGYGEPVPRQADHAALGCRVVRLSEAPRATARDEMFDDPPVVALGHARQHGAGSTGTASASWSR